MPSGHITMHGTSKLIRVGDWMQLSVKHKHVHCTVLLQLRITHADVVQQINNTFHAITGVCKYLI